MFLLIFPSRYSLCTIIAPHYMLYKTIFLTDTTHTPTVHSRTEHAGLQLMHVILLTGHSQSMSLQTAMIRLSPWGSIMFITGCQILINSCLLSCKANVSLSIGSILHISVLQRGNVLGNLVFKYNFHYNVQQSSNQFVYIIVFTLCI